MAKHRNPDETAIGRLLVIATMLAAIAILCFVIAFHLFNEMPNPKPAALYPGVAPISIMAPELDSARSHAPVK
jgi:hypothetical protein